MQNRKRKTGQRSFLQRFYDEHIAIRRDFRFELARDPDEIREALNELCRRNREHFSLAVNRLEDKPIWELLLVIWHRSYQTEAELKISREEAFTLVEGTVRQHDTSSIFFIFLGSVTALVMALLMNFVENNRHFESMRMVFFTGIIFLLLGLWGRYIALRDHDRLIKFLDRLITDEDHDLDFWWQGQYLKDKKIG